jgi:hypothetical protein
VLFKQPKVDKEMKPGKILVVTHKQHYNKLGILLSVSSQSHKETVYKVLVLDDQQMGDASPVSPNKSLVSFNCGLRIFPKVSKSVKSLPFYQDKLIV